MGKLATVNWEKEYEVERDLDALTRAAAVKKDPKRMDAVRAMAKKKIEEYKKRRDEEQAKVDLGEGKEL
jgi:hypothetical protein